MRTVPLYEVLEKRAYLAVTFSGPTPFNLNPGTSTRPPVVVAGNFSNDTNGVQDLLFAYLSDNATPTNGTLAVAVGNGNGTFAAPTPFFSTGVITGVPAVADIDGQNGPDIAVADGFNNLIRVFLNNGNGTFAAPTTVAVGAGPQTIAVGDFNTDGRADLAVGNRNGDTVTVLLGSATGALTVSATLTAGDDPASLVIADFNSDEADDIVVGNAGAATDTTGSLMFFPGTGTGTFGEPVVTNGPRGVTAVSDFDNDQRPDVAVGITAAGEAVVLLGNRNGTFSAPAGQVATTNDLAALVGDFNGDGNFDLAAAGALDGNAIVLEGRGNGRFEPAVTFPVGNPAFGGAAIDLNGDVRSDLVFVTGAETARQAAVLTSQSGPDLAGEIIGLVPPAVVGGSRGKITVRVTNQGTEPYRGPLGVAAVASANQAAEPGTDELLNGVTRNVKLKPGKAKNFKFKFNYPETLPEGNYFILGVVDTADSVGESNEQNNVAVSPTQVTIAPPFIDAVGTFADPAPTALVVGKRGQAVLAIQNAGNVPLKGKPVIRLVLSSDATVDGTDTELAMPAAGLNLKPGRARRVRLRFKTPAVTPGPYFLIATIDQTNVLTERNEANNTVSTPVTVASA